MWHGSALLAVLSAATAWRAHARLLHRGRLEVAPAVTLQGSASLTWTQCATEGSPLTLPAVAGASPGPREVVAIRFGSEFNFVERPHGVVVTGNGGSVGLYPLMCGVTVFGSDPSPGVVKSCFCGVAPASSSVAAAVGFAATASAPGAGPLWGRCGVEGQSCTTCTPGIAPRYGSEKRWVGAAPGNLAAKGTAFACGTAAFGDRDPVRGRLKECWCQLQPGAVPAAGKVTSLASGGLLSSPARHVAAPAKVAVVTVTKDPSDLPTWLRYHLRYAGVDHAFIQIEETASLSAVLEAQPKDIKDRVTHWSGSAEGEDASHRPRDNYATLQSRQMAAMAKAKGLADTMGIDWLMHIDDDELLYTPFHESLGEVFGAVPPAFQQVVVPNLEAVYKAASVKKCFLETAEANTNVHAFSGYYNGKPGIRIVDRNAYPMGPHRWQDAEGVQPLTYELNEQVPFGPMVMILHYESCPFERWEEKFWRLSYTSEDKIKGIPFPFYRDSINRMQHCEKFFKAGGFNAAGLPHECSAPEMQELWARSKTRENRAITPGDVMPIEIPWSTFLTP